jgi:hypothetical protein
MAVADDKEVTRMTVKFDSITIWLEAFIPMPKVEAPIASRRQPPLPPGTPGLKSCYHGDGRGFSSDFGETRFRMRSDVTISGFRAGTPTMDQKHVCGLTQELDCDGDAVLDSDTAPTDKMSFHDFHAGNTFPDPEGGVVDNPSENCSNVLYDGAAKNPVSPLGPDVDMNCFFTVDPVGGTLQFNGAVNSFPDYECYAQVDGGTPVTVFQHAHNLDPMNGLPGGADQNVSGTVQLG